MNYGGVRRQGRPLEQMPLTRARTNCGANCPALIGIGRRIPCAPATSNWRYTDEDLGRAANTIAQATRGFGMQPADARPRWRWRQRFGWLGDGVVGGSFCPEDGHANPRLVSPGLRAGRAPRPAPRRARAHARRQRPRMTAGASCCAAGDALDAARAPPAQLRRRLGRPLRRCASANPCRETSIHPLMMVTEPLPALHEPRAWACRAAASMRARWRAATA